MSFPITGFTSLEDSKYFSDTPGDGSLSKETDGGIFVVRKRFTRAAPRNLVTGFTAIPDSDWNLLRAFYLAQGGGAASWVYTHPLTGEALKVVFVGTMTNVYTGIGSSKLWDVSQITLRTSF